MPFTAKRTMPLLRNTYSAMPSVVSTADYHERLLDLFHVYSSPRNLSMRTTTLPRQAVSSPRPERELAGQHVDVLAGRQARFR